MLAIISGLSRMVMVIIVIFHYEVGKMLLARAKNLIKTAAETEKGPI